MSRTRARFSTHLRIGRGRFQQTLDLAPALVKGVRPLPGELHVEQGGQSRLVGMSS